MNTSPLHDLRLRTSRFHSPRWTIAAPLLALALPLIQLIPSQPAGAQAANSPPSIVGAPVGFSYLDENATGQFHRYTATDPDGDTVTWSIHFVDPTAAAAYFAITPDTGIITVETPPDYEAAALNPAGAQHRLSIAADDGNGGTDTHQITLNVTDLDEPPDRAKMPTARATGRCLATPVPERQQRQRSSPVLDRVRSRLEQLLEEWSHRTTAKQRITGRRLHRQLREEGHEVGLTLVLAELCEWRRWRAEVYVPLVHRPAESAQVDFFEVWADLAGERRPVWLLVFRLMHSGRDFVRLDERQDQLAFLDGHVRALEHFGGVPRRMVYDNLKPAVRRLQFPRRQLTERFQALSSHYLFEPCFARPGEGHDKGGVEARGQAIRLQHLTPIPREESLDELSGWLLAEVERHAPERVRDRFRKEQRWLRPIPDRAFDPRRLTSVSVGRSAMARVEGAWYSVPSHWAGLRVTARIGVDELTLSCRGEQVSHPRERFGGRRVRYRHYRYRHYLAELSRKPQAVRQVAPELVAELGEPFARLWRRWESEQGAQEAARSLARLVRTLDAHGEQRVREALEQLEVEDGFDALSLQRLLADEDPPGPVAVLEVLRGYEVETASAADYDHLLEAVVG